MNNHISLNFTWMDKKKWYVLPLGSLLLVLLYQGIVHLNPYNLQWLSDGSFSWTNFFQFILVDQALIECVTIYMIFLGIKAYSRFMKLTELHLSFRHVLIYLLKFLPLFLFIYLLYSPITTSVRYFYHTFLYAESLDYFRQYFFINPDIYLMYLFPSLLTGYSILISGIVLGEKTEAEMTSVPTIINIKSQEGETLISLKEVISLSRKNRKYLVKTQNGTIYPSQKSLKKWEEELPADEFIRINRATILRITQIKSWTYWQDQKYILRDLSGNEFVVARARMKKIKERLQLVNEMAQY